MTFNGPRLDCHHQLWTRERADRGDYHWMPRGGPLHDDYLPERLAGHLRATNVQGTVVVQAARTVEETQFLLDLAARTPFVRGVVGWAPLGLPGTAGIEALAELARNPYLRSVRPMIHDEDDPLWITRPQVIRGLTAMAELGLAFDLLSYAEHLPAAVTALAAVPDLPVVINHVSKPVYRWDADTDWRTWMARHAERPNTYCKLSGMLTEAGPGWSDAQFRPYADFLFETFGPDRVVFGSDWPVSRQLLEYPDVVALNERLTSSLSPSEAEGFWWRNGERLYRVRVEAAEPVPQR
jgi:L-fuconolactonase